MKSDNKYNSPTQLPIDSENDNSVVMHMDPMDIFHASYAKASWRRYIGLLYLLLGIALIAQAIFLSPVQTGSCYQYIFCAIGFLFLFVSICLFIAAWHKKTYRSFINEQGLGTGNQHDIPVHTWSEVDHVVERLYYRGNPPKNGVWGFAPRRLDEDFVVILKSGEKLFFGRKNLDHIHRFKPLLLFYSEQNNIEWKTQEFYHSYKPKAGSIVLPLTLIITALVIAILPTTVLSYIQYGLFTHQFVLTEEAQKEIIASRFSWPLEFLARKPDNVNQTDDPGSSSPLGLRVSSLFFNTDCTHAAIGTDNGAFYLFSLADRRELGSISNALLSAVIFTMTSPNESIAITRDFDNQLHVWNIAKQEELFSLDVPNKYYHSAIFSGEGKSLYYGDLEGRLNEYDMKSETPIKRFSGLQSPVVYVNVSEDGRKVLAGFENNSIYIWDLAMEGDPTILNIDSELQQATFSSDTRILGTLEKNGTFKIWNYIIKQETFRLNKYTHEEDKYETFAISPDGKTVALGTAQGTVGLLSISKSRIYETLRVPGMTTPSPILSVKFSPDNKYVFVASKYGIWKARLQEQ